MWRVKLNYFRSTGKWYGCGEYTSYSNNTYEVFDEVEEMLNKRILPGLIKGHSKFIVLIDVPDHPHNVPKLII